MTKDEALKLRIDDPLFIYDPGINEVYEAKVTGISVPAANHKSKFAGISISIDAWSKSMGCRTYKDTEVYGTKGSALKAQSDQLQFQADKILNVKFKVDRKIEALKEGA